MNRHLFTGAFVAGALAALWVAFGFLGTNALALAMTLLIAAVYAYGARELQGFRQATASLDTALQALAAQPEQLGDWLGTLHPSLQTPVRLRIQGERVGLPGPALTPYLLGLLVMLGMLGTFLGMVVTLNGAVFALEGTSDLEAIRAAFATPIKGLGLAFGTSVAGVATSAMLGLMSALSRRERAMVAQALDGKIATDLRAFSLAHQRQETYQALLVQSQALPAAVGHMQTMMAQMERMHEQLNARLLANQEGFHAHAKTVYTDLASSVDQSLRDSLTRSAQLAGQSIQPAVEQAMAGIASNAQNLHTRLLETTEQQLTALSARLEGTAQGLAATWAEALAQQQHTNTTLLQGMEASLQGIGSRFDQSAATLLQTVQQAHTHMQNASAASDQQRLDNWRASLETMASGLSREWKDASAHALAQQEQMSKALAHTAHQLDAQAQARATQTQADMARLLAASEELVQARVAAEAQWTQQHATRMDQLAATLRQELGALREEEAQRGQAAVERLGALQTAVTTHLATLGTALEAPITRLIHTASEAPRAAAEVIGKLREEVSQGVARDNALLEERSRILETLNGLLESIHHASTEQRGVIDALVTHSATALQEATQQFASQVGGEADKLADIAASVTSSAVEVSALGDTLGFAVKGFGEANDKLIASLQRIEAAMDKSMARSDEQLAYYVAQAREVIDLSIMSQKEIVDELRQLPAQRAAIRAEAA